MRWMSVLTLALAGLVSTGCASSSGPHRKFVWRTLSKGLVSGVTDSRRLTLRSEADFLKLWAEHAADASQIALPPKVDFTREMVLAVTLGNRPTGGYLIDIVDIELRGRTLRVLVGERSPQPGALQIQQQTQPYAFVSLPLMAARVDFRTVRDASGGGGASSSRKARPGEEGPNATRDPPPSRPKTPVQPVQSPRGQTR